MARVVISVLGCFLSLVDGSCAGDSEPVRERCGGGEGFPLDFCKQVSHYEAGYGRPEMDQIEIDCIVGPKGAAVFESPDGRYYAAGRYKLGTYPSATVDLNWGGRTMYSDHQEHAISERGEGTFDVTAEKTGGGEGNLFFSMASDSMWMFDVVPINAGCDAEGGRAFLRVAGSDDSPRAEAATYDAFGNETSYQSGP